MTRKEIAMSDETNTVDNNDTTEIELAEALADDVNEISDDDFDDDFDDDMNMGGMDDFYAMLEGLSRSRNVTFLDAINCIADLVLHVDSDDRIGLDAAASREFFENLEFEPDSNEDNARQVVIGFFDNHERLADEDKTVRIYEYLDGLDSETAEETNQYLSDLIGIII